jgi:hypothetical protein
LLLQTNVTARVELENRLADLTDAQLGMLEQLFPRHVIEYMLSHKHGYNSRNLTHLANQHDDVIVLFTDGEQQRGSGSCRSSLPARQHGATARAAGGPLHVKLALVCMHA